MKRSPQRKAALRRTTSSAARLQDRNRKKRRNFFLKRLEDRSLMAALYRTGGGGAGATDISNPLNWGGIAPQQDDSLVFPAGASNKTVANAVFPAGTRFRSITISEQGYNLSGSAITLVDGVTYNAPSGSAQV